MQAKFGVTKKDRKTKTQARVIFYTYAATPPMGRSIILSFGVQGVIADLIIYAKFFVNRFRGFGVLNPKNFTISIGLACQSYNSVSDEYVRLSVHLHNSESLTV